MIYLVHFFMSYLAQSSEMEFEEKEEERNTNQSNHAKKKRADIIYIYTTHMREWKCERADFFLLV